eukprot:scaffold3192_cov81-Skeletonema_dohrnii-CCMP3373.AAC.3
MMRQGNLVVAFWFLVFGLCVWTEETGLTDGKKRGVRKKAGQTTAGMPGWWSRYLIRSIAS